MPLAPTSPRVPPDVPFDASERGSGAREAVPGVRQRFRALDPLRFAAAMAVMAYHYAFRGFAADGLSQVRFDTLGQVARYGQVGVAAFFLVSGYVIALSIDGRAVGSFLRARALRLYPALWVCALITSAVATWSQQTAFRVSALDLFGCLTLLRVFAGPVSHGLVDGAYWSLQVELRFYAVVALLLVRAHGEAHRRVAVVLAAWVLLAAADLAHLIPGRHGWLWLDCAPFFGAGWAYAALARQRGGWLDWALLAVAVPVSLVTMVTDAARQTAHYHVVLSPWVGVSVIGALHVGFLGAALRGWDVPPWRHWPTLGAVSYPLYLLHQNVGYVALNASRGRIPPGVALTGLVIIMPCAAWVIAVVVEPRLRAAIERAFGMVPGWRRSGARAGDLYGAPLA